MNWLRKNPGFALVVLLGAAAIAAEARLLQQAARRTKHAEFALRQREEERDRLARQSPALSAENVAAVAADVVAAEAKLAELRREFAAHRGWLPEAPARSIEAFFALASFVEETRALAARQEVGLRAEERFGFSSYVNAGPDAELLGAVHRQRVLIAHLLEALLEARPRAIVAVQRERPRADASRATSDMLTTEPPLARDLPEVTGQAADFFEPVPRLRLRAPGLADTDAFRLEFTGQTQTLRGFLNGLSAFKLPFVVRSVEVEPLPIAPAATGDGAFGAPVPLIAQNFSKFSVVVEFVELASAATPARP